MIFITLRNVVKVKDGHRDRFRDLSIDDILLCSPSSFTKRIHKSRIDNEIIKAQMEWDRFIDHRSIQLSNYMSPNKREQAIKDVFKFASDQKRLFANNKKALYAWYLQNYVYHLGRQKICYLAVHLGIIEADTSLVGWVKDWNDEYSREKVVQEWHNYQFRTKSERFTLAIQRLNQSRKPSEKVIEKTE
jgi:hypothetical protein